MKSFFVHLLSLSTLLVSPALSVPVVDAESETPFAIKDAAGWHNTTKPLTLEEAGLVLKTIPDDVKRNVPLPSWLTCWEDLEFVTKRDMYSEYPLFGDSDNITIKAAAYAFSHASGHWLDPNKLEKRDLESENITQVLLDFLVTGEKELAEEDSELAKRAWMCFRKLGWNRRYSHVAQASALQVLSNVVIGSCNWVTLGRSAYCGQDNDGNQACVSWSGGWQSVLGCVAHAALDSAAGDFGADQGLSCFCPNGLREYTKRDSLARRDVFDDQICISDRPNGCGDNTHETHDELKKRFNWDTDAYGWCEANGIYGK